MRDLPKRTREHRGVFVKKPMQNEILLDPAHLAHVNKTEIELNTDFAFYVSCSNFVDRFECKKSIETEKYTKADVELVMTLIREPIDERLPNGNRRKLPCCNCRREADRKRFQVVTKPLNANELSRR